MNNSGNNAPIIIAQIIGWAVMFVTPAITSMTMAGDYAKLSVAVSVSLRTVGPLCALYFLNYFLLAPKFLFGSDHRNRVWFYVINIVVLAAWNYYRYLLMQGHGQFPSPAQNAFTPYSFKTLMWIGILTRVSIELLVIAIAAGIKMIEHANRLLVDYEQERRNAAEAELSWLKNQLNPHFLFNTLNNISSLTQIDADKAQDSICQLSDLLRYALYDSEKEFVPLEGEIDFMNNYIRLMQLRCNELATVECSLEKPAAQVEIAPLLFISLIENAFKHGVNARKESFVKIDLHQDGHDLVFSCENSIFEPYGSDTRKTQTDHIGSGIGLENMKKRLSLLYAGRYEYITESHNGRYSAVVRLKNAA